jgi:hypothetical protein
MDTKRNTALQLPLPGGVVGCIPTPSLGARVQPSDHSRAQYPADLEKLSGPEIYATLQSVGLQAFF